MLPKSVKSTELQPRRLWSTEPHVILTQEAVEHYASCDPGPGNWGYGQQMSSRNQLCCFLCTLRINPLIVNKQILEHGSLCDNDLGGAGDTVPHMIMIQKALGYTASCDGGLCLSAPISRDCG